MTLNLPPEIQNMIGAAVGVGGGIVGGGSLVVWLGKRYISKVDRLIRGFSALAASFDAWKEVNSENRKDIKDHEKRITILEPKVSRAHQRLDEMIASKH